MYQTFQPSTIAPDFELPNHYRMPTSLDMLIYGRGLLLGFIGDIWQPANVRRIVWIQRHLHKISQLDLSVALLACDQPHTLYGFQVSAPLPTMFPLLADSDGAVHKAYGMEHQAGVVLIDPHFEIRYTWYLTEDDTWPKVNDVMFTIKELML